MQQNQPRMRFQVNFDYLLKVTKMIPQPIQKVEEQYQEESSDSDFEEAPLKRQRQRSVIDDVKETQPENLSTKDSSANSSPKNCSDKCQNFFGSDKKECSSPILKQEEKVYVCPLDCECKLTNQKMTITELTIHLRTQCPKMQVHCLTCKQKMLRGEQHTHQRTDCVANKMQTMFLEKQALSAELQMKKMKTKARTAMFREQLRSSINIQPLNNNSIIQPCNDSIIQQNTSSNRQIQDDQSSESESDFGLQKRSNAAIFEEDSLLDNLVN